MKKENTAARVREARSDRLGAATGAIAPGSVASVPSASGSIELNSVGSDPRGWSS